MQKPIALKAFNSFFVLGFIAGAAVYKFCLVRRDIDCFIRWGWYVRTLCKFV